MYKFNMISIQHYHLYFALLFPTVVLVALDDVMDKLRSSMDDAMFSLSALFDVFCSDGRFFGDDCAAGVDICLGLTVAPLLATGSVISGTAGEENSASAARYCLLVQFFFNVLPRLLICIAFVILANSNCSS